MHAISKAALVRFWASLSGREQATATAVLTEWYRLVCAANWRNFSEVKATFNTADWVGNGKVVFDVGGNKYRVVCLVGFRSKRVFILFVGTHAQYDALDVAKL